MREICFKKRTDYRVLFMSAEQIVINRLITEVTVHGNRDHFTLQRELTGYCHENVLPELSNACNHLEGIPETVTIDRLTLDLGTFDATEFPKLFAAKLGAKFIDELVGCVEKAIQCDRNKSGSNRIPNSNSMPVVDPIQRTINLFLFFLKHGAMPWWSNSVEMDRLGESMNRIFVGYADALKSCITNIVALISGGSFNDPGRLRMIDTLSDNALLSLCDNLNPLIRVSAPSGDDYRTMARLLSVEEVKIRQMYWETVMVSLLGIRPPDALANDGGGSEPQVQCRPDNPRFLKRIEQYSRFSSSELKPPPGPQPVSLQSEGPIVYTDIAGVVLAGVYLHPFFQHLGFVDKHGAMTEQNQAVRALYYLCTGSGDYSDWKAALCKVLAGVELEAYIEPKILSEDVRQKCDELAAAMVKNWGALKNTSVAGLREAFLVRKGQLMQRDNDWLLRVERQSYDLLLEKLPWIINPVKQRWMEKPLTVEW
jgi:hypothetical protein